MSYDNIDQIIACAAILLAIMLFRLLPYCVRNALFIMMFGTGLLAAVAGIANNAANAMVTSLFG